ncbi:hypothetical protein [Sphingomonas hankookensis]|uniref:hypothetical protein n=1 Tax=Sphingomonas hankookensis TaxID=563996 RepID=UPI003F79213B
MTRIGVRAGSRGRRVAAGSSSAGMAGVTGTWAGQSGRPSLPVACRQRKPPRLPPGAAPVSSPPD